MKKVAILLSTYNGEKYLAAQIDSILNQDYENLMLYIRDDGSDDNTVNIINQKISETGKIKYIQDGKRLGYPDCFWELLFNKNINADYYMFADQDDVWYKDKVSRAVSVIEKNNNDLSLCYFSGYDICDSQLNIVGQKHYGKTSVSFVQTLFEVAGLEFTMLLNKQAVELVKKYRPIKSKTRGVWLNLLYSSNGQIILDNYLSAKYRRHEAATTNSSLNFFGKIIWQIKKFVISSGNEDYLQILKEFEQIVGKSLNDDDRKCLQLMISNKGLRNRICKMFYPKRLRSNFVDEIGLRFLFLLGKF